MHSTPKIRLMPRHSHEQRRKRGVASAGARYGISDDAVASRSSVNRLAVRDLGLRRNEREHGSKKYFVHFVFDARAIIE
jgi:hypothetical protein